jgi:hypothetical protein
MSYDIRIAADRMRSKTLPLRQTLSSLAELPGVRANGSRCLVFEDGERLRMEIDLEFLDDEGTALEDSDSINSIALHIPYAHLGDAPERDYFPLARSIAQEVGWVATDAQTDKAL